MLRVLQEREFERVGGTRTIKLDVRLGDRHQSRSGRGGQAGPLSRGSLLSPQRGVVRMPALRERREDIPLLASYFAAKFSQRSNRPVLGVSPHACTCLTNYDWPGNMRELENAIERAVVLGSSDMILPEVVLEKAESAGATMTAFHDALVFGGESMKTGAGVAALPLTAALAIPRMLKPASTCPH
jgi:DNA-binding NtrC family response regulator